MRRIGAITLFELKRIFKKPQSYLLMFGMPLLFTLIFGGLFSDEAVEKPNIVIVDHDQSTLSEAFIHELQGKNLMNMSFENSKDARVKFDDQQITGYIQMEKGFEEWVLNNNTPQISFISTPSFEGAPIIEQAINDSMLNTKIVATASTMYQDFSGDSWEGVQREIARELVASTSTIETMTITKNENLAMMNNMTARSAGFTIMFVMMTMLISTAVILEARQTGVWYRMMSTPVTKGEILVGYLFAFFLIGWIQFGVLMIASNLIFQIDWGNVLGNFVLISSILLCTIGIGLFIAGFVKTSEQQSVFGNLLIVSTCMLGGVYWPLEIMPDFMQQIAKFVPQYWGLEGFAELSVRGGTVLDIAVPVGILLAFTCIFLVVGMSRIRFE